MKFFVVLAAVVMACNAKELYKRQAGGQNPKVFSALDILRGGADKAMIVSAIQELFLSAKPGQDYPTITEVPSDPVDCAQYKQPGFYADTGSSKCQVFHRCDVNGNGTSYVCPNMTIFNQITLVCDWWFNVDCSKAQQFYDYSNSRLYQDTPLLDDESDYVPPAAAAAAAGEEASGSSKSMKTEASSSSKKGSGSKKQSKAKKA